MVQVKICQQDTEQALAVTIAGNKGLAVAVKHLVCLFCGVLNALAVYGRLKKSNYFLERVHVPDRSGIRFSPGEREASMR